MAEADEGYYLNTVLGRRVQKRATLASAGTADAGKIPRLGSDGKLHASVMAAGTGQDVKPILASENLSIGLVNFYNNAGVTNVRKADASAPGKEANGYVLSAWTSGQTADVFMEGTLSGLSGMTPGARQYLSATTPGARTETAPTGAGQVVQFVGHALSATELSFEPEDGDILAS